MTPEDPYSRLDYRRLIAWPQRIAREAPFLDELLATAPRRRALDLGCGTGEHARFLADRGFETVGVDRSAAMLETAGEDPSGNPRFLHGDLADLRTLVDGAFGVAICLGNTLPHLLDPEALGRFARGLREHLADGAPCLLQLLNYDKIFADGQRTLPVHLRPREGAGGPEDVVFLRLMTPHEDGTVTFNPTSLRYRPGAEPPVEVVATKNVTLRGWRWDELRQILRAAGFRRFETFGGMRREPWDPTAASDLVIVAR